MLRTEDLGDLTFKNSHLSLSSVSHCDRRMSDESHRERAKQLVEYAVITGGVTTSGVIIDGGLCFYRAMLQSWTQIRL